VILLDEIEKAHPDVFNILLQILDDGILTDSYGRHVNFKNTIIIMTSNAGTRDVRKTASVGFGKSTDVSDYEAMKGKVMDELKRIFNPEFLNRVDDTIVFNPLGKEEIAKIVDIQLQEVSGKLSERNVSLEVSQSAKEFILEHGFDPILGARPMRRSIQKLVEDRLAEEFLNKRFDDGDTVTVDAGNGELTFSKARLADETP
jgi:ATP-dependent Clp protease ATP-binding subunit ClpC